MIFPRVFEGSEAHERAKALGEVRVFRERGALVNRDARLVALASGMICGAGLDVFHDEPLKPGDPLLGFASTVLSPHNAGQTPEVRRDGLLKVIENVERCLAGKPANTVSA